MKEFLLSPWPWYVVGPLIGLTVPLLLLIGNKALGISSSLRHLCAMCAPAKVPFFQYDWRDHAWNLFFVLGVFLGAVIAALGLNGVHAVDINPATREALVGLGITDFSGLMPADLFSWQALATDWRAWVFTVVGGFFVGFGTRYAGGCTSGHSIMGLSNLQWPSLVATCCFMAGGIFTTWVIFPLIFG
jgi:uncharacterized membrane protein YedE/YeeE